MVYLVDDEPVTGEVQIPREDLIITADPGTGYVLAEDAENRFSYSCTLTFDDLPGEIEQPEEWEADPEAWCSNAPASNLPEYSDEIRELGWAVDQDTENRLQRFGQGASVYASPGLDSELLGGLTHTASEEYWWGYLHESDFWMFWHQPTGAAGFVPGESCQGDEDPSEPGDYTITAQSLGREVSAEIDITVVEPIEPAGVGGGEVTVDPGVGGAPAPAPTDGLAVTGAEARTGIIAGALLALGAGLVAFANRARLFGRRQG